MTVIRRSWGSAMTDESLAACRADIETAEREQLAQDVADLLDEVSRLRFLITCLATAHNGP